MTPFLENLFRTGMVLTALGGFIICLGMGVACCTDKLWTLAVASFGLAGVALFLVVAAIFLVEFPK